MLADLGIDIGFFRTNGSTTETRVTSVLRGETVEMRIAVQDLANPDLAAEIGRGEGPMGVIGLPINIAFDDMELQPTRTLVPTNNVPINDELITDSFTQRRVLIGFDADAGPFDVTAADPLSTFNIRGLGGGAIPALGNGSAIGSPSPGVFSRLSFLAVGDQPTTTTVTVGLDGSMSFADGDLLRSVFGLVDTVGINDVLPNAVQATLGIRGGSISGHKFDDANGNGVRDPGELPVSGITIRLDPATEGLPNIDLQTDADGKYSFINLAAGQYTVTEIVDPARVLVTTPPGNSHTVDLSSDNADVTDLDFGNFTFVTLSGEKFNDLNDNGVRDDGEPGLEGVMINLDLFNDSVLDQTVLTDADGVYRFEAIGPGTHRVFETVPTGFRQTLPANGADHIVTTTSRQDVAGLDFGNTQITSTVSGLKFDDLDGDGVQDAGEPGFPGITIVLSSMDASFATRSTTTDAEGRFAFEGVPAGAFMVNEMLPVRTIQTTPVGGFAIDVVPPGAVGDLVFGNFRLTDWTGIKFEDANGNGVQDAGELGIADVTINLDLNNDGTIDATQRTDADGRYTFAEIGPGTHRVTETVPMDFEPTTPPVSGYLLQNRSGDAAAFANLNFGNRRIITPPPNLGSLSGFVYADVDLDGQFDATEIGLPGVSVTLSGGGFTRTITTSADGGYQFNDLPAGTYTVTQTQPDRFADASITQGRVLPGGDVRGTAVGLNQFSGITIGLNETGIDYNFGEVFTAVTKRMFLASANARGELIENLDLTQRTIQGTPGDDVVVIRRVDGDAMEITVNQNAPLRVAASAATIVIVDTLTGRDSVTFIGDGSAETFRGGPGSLTVDSGSQSLAVIGAESVRVDGGGGADVAELRDSSGADELFAEGRVVALSTASGDTIGLVNIPTVRAVSTLDSPPDLTAIAAIDFALQLAGDWVGEDF